MISDFVARNSLSIAIPNPCRISSQVNAHQWGWPYPNFFISASKARVFIKALERVHEFLVLSSARPQLKLYYTRALLTSLTCIRNARYIPRTYSPGRVRSSSFLSPMRAVNNKGPRARSVWKLAGGNYTYSLGSRMVFRDMCMPVCATSLIEFEAQSHVGVWFARYFGCLWGCDG